MRVIVTGSTKGIGKAVASELLGLGASVLVHSRSAADVQQQVDEWRAVHGPERVHGFAADVSSPGGRQLLIAYTANLWGGKLVSWTNACLTSRARSLAIQLSQTGPAALRRRR
jgi:Tropinone reductase 1